MSVLALFTEEGRESRARQRVAQNIQQEEQSNDRAARIWEKSLSYFLASELMIRLEVFAYDGHDIGKE